MSLSPLPSPSSNLTIIKTFFYILAGLILLLGLVAGISLMASASQVAANATLPLQIFGGGAISNLISPLLSGFLTNLGIGVMVVSLLLSALLYAVGRLLGHTASLEARLARLESRSTAEN
jgi:hypothetical protein